MCGAPVALALLDGLWWRSRPEHVKHGDQRGGPGGGKGLVQDPRLGVGLESLAGAQGNVSAVAINAHGDVVGTSARAAGSSTTSGPFVYHHSNGAELALNGFAAGGINDSGNIAGELVNLPMGPQAVVWSKSGGVEILPANTLAVFSRE